MPKTLKTFVTQVGFFDLAVAAPSMKAALEIWGMKRNAFHQGFAHQSDDPNIIAATNAKPGVVLKRAVGTNGEFKENAELPTDLPAFVAQADPHAPKRKTANKIKPAVIPPKKADRAAIISFEKEKARLERERDKQEEGAKRRRDQRLRNIKKAEAALDAARQTHENTASAIEGERDKLDQRAEAEEQRWRKERTTLETAMRKASE